jgi:hypothetical protein
MACTAITLPYLTYHIQDLFDDIEHQLMTGLKSCNGFSLQINKSTEVFGLALLLLTTTRIHN